jgi:septal ring factor EnvC (AmiA/AmiB activator)
MARAKTTKTTKPVSKIRKTGKLATTKSAKTVKSVSAPKKEPSVRAPVVSKDELRAQLEKLQTANATLRTKSREVGRAAKAAEARIAELEDQVVQLEAKLASQTKPMKSGAAATKPTKPGSRKVGAGDAPSLGGVSEEPGLADDEAETATEN